jgi:excisionase family DNA binding protein
MAKQPVGFGPSARDGAATAAVFVRVPVAEARRLDRVAGELRRPKRQIVAALLSAVDTEAGRLVLGQAGFEPARAGAAGGFEVLTAAEAAALLRVETDAVVALAESGDLPARSIGDEWRFSRRAVLDWLGGREGDGVTE